MKTSRVANDAIESGVWDLMALPVVLYTFRVGADGEASFPYVSPACSRVYGFTAEAAMSDVSLMHMAVHPEDRSGFDEEGQHSLRTLQPVHWEGRIVRPDGSVCLVVVHSQPSRFADGATDWVGAVIAQPLDFGPGLSSVTLSPARLVTGTESDVQSRAHEVGDALAMLGHDVAGPLTAILAVAELALDDLAADLGDAGTAAAALLRNRLQTIVRQAHRLSDLRDDFLTIASADANALEARSVAVHVLTHLRAATDIDSSGLRLVVDCSEDLYCTVQPTHLQQMLGNLVGNALRFAERVVTVSAARAGKRVLITVTDDGPGVPTDAVPRLFQRFAHAGLAVRPPSAGAGLGLYIVRSLASANGGTVLYTPGDGGTRFIIALPDASPSA